MWENNDPNFGYEYNKRRYRPGRRTRNLWPIVLTGTILLVLILSGAMYLAFQPSAAELKDEAAYSELVDYANGLRAEGLGELSRPVADAEYQKARAFREFSEKHGRRPKYKPPGKR